MEGIDRRSYIGSTDISCIAGINPYRSALTVWAEKRGLLPPKEDNEAMWWGRSLEENIAQRFLRDRAFHTAESSETVFHPQFSYMGATPDRIITSPEGRYLLECKTSGSRSSHRWGSEGDDIPEEYLVQVAWQLGICRLAMPYLRDEVAVALLLGGQEYREYTYQRDPELEAGLFTLAERFWTEHVLTGVAPAADGSESSSNTLSVLHPKHTPGVIVPATAEWEDAARTYHELTAIIKGKESEADAEKNLLRQAIGDAEGMAGCGWSISYKAAKSTDKVAWEKVAREAGASPELIAKHTQEKPGSRRFLFTWKGELTWVRS